MTLRRCYFDRFSYGLFPQIPSFFKEHSKKDKLIAEIIFKGIDEINKNPYCCKLLVGNFKGSRSKRKGNYRIIYKIYEEKNMIYIMNVGHRDDVYG